MDTIQIAFFALFNAIFIFMGFAGFFPAKFSKRMRKSVSESMFNLLVNLGVAIHNGFYLFLVMSRVDPSVGSLIDAVAKPYFAIGSYLGLFNPLWKAEITGVIPFFYILTLALSPITILLNWILGWFRLVRKMVFRGNRSILDYLSIIILLFNYFVGVLVLIRP